MAPLMASVRISVTVALIGLVSVDTEEPVDDPVLPLAAGFCVLLSMTKLPSSRRNTISVPFSVEWVVLSKSGVQRYAPHMEGYLLM